MDERKRCRASSGGATEGASHGKAGSGSSGSLGGTSSGVAGGASGGAADGEAGALEPRTTGDGSFTLYSSRFAQTFHSHHGALRESQHVFLECSGAGRRLRRGEPTKVLEVGFGTGLNFLLTANAALGGGARLEYVALERELLPAELVAGLGYQAFAGTPLAEYLGFRSTLPEVVPSGNYMTTVAGAELELRLGEAQAAAIEESHFDAIYHDAFSPDANPELWTQDFLTTLANAMRPGAVLSSYTVKGEVRRRLAAAGLQVRKAPGPPGGKREMLVAVKPGAQVAVDE